MCREDEEMTAFHTDRGMFCYQKCHFDSKNLGQHTSTWWTKSLAIKSAGTWKLHWWHGYQKPSRSSITRSHEGNLLDASTSTDETQFGKVYIQSRRGPIPRFLDNQRRNRTKPSQYSGTPHLQGSSQPKGGSGDQWKINDTRLVHRQVSQKIAPTLPHPKGLHRQKKFKWTAKADKALKYLKEVLE